MSRTKKIVHSENAKPQVRHSEVRTLQIALRYKGSNFFRDHENEYIHAYRNGFHKKLRRILKSRKNGKFQSERKEALTILRKRKPNKGKPKWDLQACKKDALKFKTRSEWLKQSGVACRKAYKEGWHKVCCLHMPEIVKWTKEKCKEDALKYKARTEWYEKSPRGYATAHLNGWLNICCKHMQRKRKWTEEKCREDALKYETKSKWRSQSSGPFTAASKNGWLKSCCQHMVKGYGAGKKTREILRKLGEGKKRQLLYLSEFSSIASLGALKLIFHRLVRKDFITRLAQGIYMMPPEKAKPNLRHPSAEELANSFAKKEGLKIIPTGAYGLYKLGMTKQIPRKLSFFSNGHACKFQYGKNIIEFKKVTPEKFEFASRKSGLIIHSLDGLDIHLNKISIEGKHRLKQELLKEKPNVLTRSIEYAPKRVREFLSELL
jgi:hypothetical protein